MDGTWTAFLVSVGAVTLAEMGDKTQLLAIAFSSRYKATKVLLGVFIATILNHGLAVLLGQAIGQIAGLELWIKGLAALSFVFFGLWTIRGDKLDGEDKKPVKYGAIATVAIAFFIAELGDKTQLATISLAVNYPNSALAVLMGTTTGMLIADGVGVLLGALLYRCIPEKIIKLVSAGAFMVFGYIGFYQFLNAAFTLGSWAYAIDGALVILSLSIAYKLYQKDRSCST